MGSVKKIKIGKVAIGGGEKIAVQSMLNTATSDVESSAAQIKRLEAVGCDIVRCAVPDLPSARAIEKLKESAEIPIVADIHFDYKLALAALEAGADKIRINPGNIGSEENIKKVVCACRAKGAPIRIGVNGGSLEKDLVAKYGSATAPALVESALRHVRLLEKFDFGEIAVSVKSSNCKTVIDSYRMLSERCAYPLHLGVTEAGGERLGIIKSAAAFGALLTEGIGDTIRVSLTADPVREIAAANDILKALGLNESGVTVISCPTCGRTKIDLIEMAAEVERLAEGIKKKLTVAVMGCVVNGPGEAREADYGIAGGDGVCAVFKKGAVVASKIPQSEAVDYLIKMIESEIEN